MKTVIALLLVLMTGCASIQKTDLAKVESNVAAHTVSLHENVKDLTLVGITFDFRWMMTGIGYYAQDGSLLRRDAWKVILVDENGVEEASAIMGDGCVNILALIEKPNQEIVGKHIYIVSGGGEETHSKWSLFGSENERHSKSMLDVNGEIIGPLARNPANRGEIDLDKLQLDAVFRKEFLKQHPSVVKVEQVFDASEGTQLRDTFLAEMRKRFPGITRDGKSRVSKQSLVASGESNQSTTMDKVLSNVHVTVGPGIAAFPVVPAIQMAGIIVASFQAAQLPLHISSEGGEFDKLEFVDRIGECHRNLAVKLANKYR